MKRLALLVLAALALATAWALWRRAGGAGGELRLERRLALERAAAHFERDELGAAREALAPLVARPDAALEDLERAAAVEHMDRERGDPTPLFERIRALDPGSAPLHYMLARRALEDGEFERALEHFRAALERAPDDLASRVGLAATLVDLGRDDEARAALAAVIELGVEHAGSWYVQALYRLGQLALRTGAEDEAQRLLAQFEQLRDLGYRSATPAELDRGTLVGVRAPGPAGIEGALPGTPPRFGEPRLVAQGLAGASELHALDLDADGDADFLTAGPFGARAALRSADGSYAVEDVLPPPVGLVRAFDLGNDDTLDLVAARDAELVVLEHASGAELLLGAEGAARWSPSPLGPLRFPDAPRDLELVDFDHDGDLDLFAVGAFGARLLRNDGAAPRVDEAGAVTRGAWVDASEEASLPRDVELSWCAIEDFDADHDVDLLLGGPARTFLMSSLRAGRFEDVAERVLGPDFGNTREPLLADVDGDARVDLLSPGPLRWTGESAGGATSIDLMPPATLWRQRPDGTFAPEETSHRIRSGAMPLACDLDLDGTLDAVWASPNALAQGALGLGLEVERALELAGPRGVYPLALVDADGDLDLDLARATERGLELAPCEGPVGAAVRVEPLGLKDNRRAVGAVVEARTRGLYRRIFWRGGPELLGCGGSSGLDVVRITWPNGAVQTRLDVAPGGGPLLDVEGRFEQKESLIGSCPFLYAWNGSTFGFVSDVLGGTPLGLPIAPGVLVPPDHDEFVLVRGDQLVERDGRLELQLTEELREVTYLDRARLDVVDHPAGVAVYPNERFSFPPFPEPHVHSVEEPLAPSRALGSDGRDWTAALAARDDVHAAPFRPLEPQLLGLATPHWLELEFDPARVRSATRLRLVCTGWFYWTDASVNMASARTPGVRFVPPTLQLPGPEGEWRDAGPPLGFPAGKSKTMVIELGERLDRERPRLRLASTLRLYWDSIELAVDGDDAPRRVSELEPLAASLWSRGFSRPLPPARADCPERFDWDALEAHARWDPHPGRYTRYGDVLELLGAADDRFVILGSGDALALSFDARALPPLPEGWARDYLLYLDGWAKDRDPNTLEALSVEPLPFHGMSGYPYGEDERFPDGPEHERWRQEWNTREARPWIPPLAPRREAEWLGSAAPLAR